MRRWQIFVVGILALLGVLALPFYERFIASAGAIALLAAALYGFVLQPHHEIFHVRTTTPFVHNGKLIKEHELIAVKVEVVRLWLLFLPTAFSLWFLVVTAAYGSTWNVRFLNKLLTFEGGNSYLIFMLFRGFLLVVAAMLSAWITERRTLRDALATSAEYVSQHQQGRIGYAFLTEDRSYYGGECFFCGITKPRALARLVFYSSANPDKNKIASGLLFHRPVIFGHGLTDLDAETKAARLKVVARQVG